MSVQALCQEAFQDLGAGDLPVEWVNGVWNSNFCDSSSLPEEVESIVLNTEKWSAALASCRQWLTRDIQEDNEGFDGGFWSTIVEVNVSHKSLMALTYCLMERCKQTAVARLCATYAAQLYLVLLQMPGSGAFKIFHPMIFQKALDVFYMWPERESVEEHKGKKKKPKDPPASQKATSTRGTRKGKHGKRKRPNTEGDEDGGVGGVLEVEPMGEEGGEGEEEEGEENSMSSLGSEVQLSEEENTEIKDSIRQLSLDLHRFLCSYSLRDHEASRYQVIQVLVRLTRTELVAASAALISQSTLGPDCPLCLRAWSCLDLVFKPLHGGVERTATEVFQQLLPSLLLLTSAGNVCTSSSLPALLTTICQHTLTFVCHIFEQHGEAVMGPLKTLFQHLCTKAPDKAEYRNKLASVACRILTLFPDQRYSQLLDWIYKFSRNTKVAYRMFALDLVTELLTVPARKPTHALPVEDEGRLTCKFLVKMILSRCSDKAPSVRSKALVCLSSATSSSLSGVVEAAKWCIHSYTTADPLAGESSNDRLIVSMLKRRAVDNKVGVRKAAIQALESVIRLDMDKIDNEDVQAIHERCLDPALSVRKQALASLTALMVDRPDLEFMQRLWLDGVLPSVMDREAGGQEKCMSLLEQIILCSIGMKRRTTEVGNFVWKLLSIIAEEENLELRRYLRKALEYWSKEQKLTPAFIEAICSEVNDPEHGKAAWILLSEMSQYTSSIPNKFILSAWKHSSAHILSTPEDDSPFLQVVTVVGNAAHSLGKVAIGDIKEKIEGLLLTVRISPAVIAASINTLLQLCSVLKPQQYQTVVDGWCEPLLKMCDEYLSSVVLCTSDEDSQESVLDEKEVIRHLFILGEVAQLSPNNLSQHTSLMVQSLLVSNSDEASTSTGSFKGGPPMPLMKKITLTSVLRAHVYITLGKLCLQNEELAKKCVAQMSKELETSECPAVKNNVIVVLCDLAVRYSARIDPYIPVVSSCMKDPSLMVRKQSLTLLTHLLQEDYVKWKGSLFFRFITTLLDGQLKKFAEFCLGHLLFTRHPTMFYQHFVECVFHFNNYEKHRVYNRFRQTEREKTLFCLKGAKCAVKRMEIYTFLLNHMTDEQRFQLTAKLCQEVIGGIVDRAITVEGEDATWLVKDTLAILASKEIKLTSLRRNLVEELADDGDMVGAAVASAQTKIISQMVKRNVIENIVPTVVSAKHLFEKEHSPLLKDLLTYLKELLNDYKNEVDGMLGPTPLNGLILLSSSPTPLNGLILPSSSPTPLNGLILLSSSPTPLNATPLNGLILPSSSPTPLNGLILPSSSPTPLNGLILLSSSPTPLNATPLNGLILPSSSPTPLNGLILLSSSPTPLNGLILPSSSPTPLNGLILPSSSPTPLNGLILLSSSPTPLNGLILLSSSPTLLNGLILLSSSPTPLNGLILLSSSPTPLNGLILPSSSPTPLNGLILLSSSPTPLNGLILLSSSPTPLNGLILPSSSPTPLNGLILLSSSPTPLNGLILLSSSPTPLNGLILPSSSPTPLNGLILLSSSPTPLNGLILPSSSPTPLNGLILLSSSPTPLNGLILLSSSPTPLNGLILLSSSPTPLNGLILLSSSRTPLNGLILLSSSPTPLNGLILPSSSPTPLNDVLGADPQLAEELAFDLKRFEEEQRRATIQLPVPKTPLAQLASPLLTPGALSSPVNQAATLERVPFTPPRLRHTSRRDVPLSPLAVAATNRARRPPAAPLPCTPPAAVRNPAISRVVGRTLGVSPLVAVAQTARAHLPSRLNQEARLPPPPPTTTASVPGSAQVNPDPLTTPVAPRTLARAINADYRPHIVTPVRILPGGSDSPHLTKTPQLNLQRMPVSTGEPNSAGHRLPPRPAREALGDESILPCGRVASTPEGLAEMISFNASTMVPPSPIPSNTSVQSYMDARRTAKPNDGASKRACPAPADIMMMSPDVEPRRLDKWKVK
ncbi:hypothetical protein EMCRGX_G023519 [Ephydatia muelleri]